jgi:hypothetical protein
MHLRTFALLLYYFGVAFSLLGVLVQSIEFMSAGVLSASVGYALRDYLSREDFSITPITVNAIFFGTWLGLGNLVGYYVRGTEYEGTFYGYADMHFLLEAQVLSTIAAVIPLVIYPRLNKLVAGPNAPLPRIPGVGFDMSDRTALILCLILLAIGWANTISAAALGSLGTFSSIVGRGSELAIFILTWHWFGPKPTFPAWTKWLLFAAIICDVTYSLLFSYMRGEVVYPLLMFFLALMMRKAMTKKHIALVLLLLPVLAFVYRGIGELRGYGIYGAERVTKLTEQLGPGAAGADSPEEREGIDNALMTLMARGCLFGQLSQVARIVDEEGYYDGETLEYITYAFIPRIIWPEKPLITPGQWFAEKIGRGWRISDTSFSNSINMTLAGEFYLNFGWIGAILGVALMTFLFAIFWSATGFYDKGNNPVGQVLGISILFQATVSSSAAGILNLIFLYIAMLAISRGLIFIRRRRNRLASTRQKPTNAYLTRNAQF